jgi:sulfatase maturation enzyme AslB (radical SAM superfamily)
MPDTSRDAGLALDPAKFSDPERTASGEQRAEVALRRLETVWFNTGSLCNIACANCYIESSPRNDRLAYLSLAEVRRYLDEIATEQLPVGEIGFTGGEPFLNPDCPAMLAEALARGFRVLVLTNAMQPMWRHRQRLEPLRDRHGAALTVRVSIDHYEPARHEQVRGAGTWAPMVRGLRWLAERGFTVHVAARTLWHEPEAGTRAGFASLFAAEGIPIDAADPVMLTLFPEMDLAVDVPEITVRCWELLGKTPDQMMCASSRMIVKHKGAAQPVVVPCTLLPYEARFILASTLADARGPVKLNHPFCAQFCVLGGASCSAGG